MLCEKCKSEMVRDDKDERFRGCFDLYMVCPNCDTSCIVEFRWNQKFRELWRSSVNGEEEWIYKFNIKKEWG